MEVVEVQEKQFVLKITCACDRCGSTNEESTREISKQEVESLGRETSHEFWKEDTEKGVVYRLHQESSEYRCRRSC